MVQKSKGGKKCRSVKSGKEKRNQRKYNRKLNYKKKKIKKEECVICYQNVEIKNDNMIQCGKKIHILCIGCKSKIKGDCPMCRSHKVPQPDD